MIDITKIAITVTLPSGIIQELSSFRSNHNIPDSSTGHLVLTTETGSDYTFTSGDYIYNVIYQIKGCIFTLKNGASTSFMTWGDFNDVSISATKQNGWVELLDNHTGKHIGKVKESYLYSFMKKLEEFLE